jgi:hypothetical protein
MNFANFFKAVDALIVFRETAKQFRAVTAPPPTAESALTPQAAGQALPGQIETRLTNVVVAALKEAFDRDHARLELERLQIEEQRRRAEATLRLELRRQASDREVGRLRLLAGAAMVGWIASVLMLVLRTAAMSTPSRAAIAVGWLLLLGALGAAFTAQGRIATLSPDDDRPLDSGPAGIAALWLLIAGLAVSAFSLLIRGA